MYDTMQTVTFLYPHQATITLLLITCLTRLSHDHHANVTMSSHDSQGNHMTELLTWQQRRLWFFLCVWCRHQTRPRQTSQWRRWWSACRPAARKPSSIVIESIQHKINSLLLSPHETWSPLHPYCGRERSRTGCGWKYIIVDTWDHAMYTVVTSVYTVNHIHCTQIQDP